MIGIIDKYKKGKIIFIGKNKAIVVSDLMKFKEFYAIYADVVENIDFGLSCGTYKIHDKVALIIRDKKNYQKCGLTDEERKAIYCHELGHCFSHNQKESTNGGRNTSDEIDSDNFAVKYCGVSPYTLERALAKSYEYEIKKLPSKNVSKERINRYLEEMRARKLNAEKLIRESESIER